RALVDYIEMQMAIQINAQWMNPNIPCPRYAFQDNDWISIRSDEIAQMLWNKASPHDHWFELVTEIEIWIGNGARREF
ncbi:hypothetical protein BG006_005468, partial [Podila minutissima]